MDGNEWDTSGRTDKEIMESHVCQCSVCEKQGDAANARIAELEAQATSWREAHERGAAIAAEELARQKEEYEARAERLEAALREIAEGEFNCGDWVCDAPGIAQNALDELAGPGHEGGKSE